MKLSEAGVKVSNEIVETLSYMSFPGSVLSKPPLMVLLSMKRTL
jgi:hypothetical protein